MTSLVIKREFKADKAHVFNAWAKAENMQQWWGPKGFDTKVADFKFTPGGHFHYAFESAGNSAMWDRFWYQRIEAPHTLEFINAFSNEAGEITRAPFSAIWPLEIWNTVTLEENNGHTTLTLQGKPVNSTAEEDKTFEDNLQNMQIGFGDTFNRLEAFLAQ